MENFLSFIIDFTDGLELLIQFFVLLYRQSWAILKLNAKNVE